MRLLIPPEIISQLVSALAQAGKREIGGILMGEHVGVDTFRVKELTIQTKGGTFAAFKRIVAEFLAPLRAFFDATKHDYTRFNYLGEWHSHHSFALSPSERDHLTMYDIVMDQKLCAHFVVLLLVKLADSKEIEGSVVVYQPNKPPFKGTVIKEGSL
ncbi:MAG TPA: Mov34/MPN/PAD-1 family protein [Verrucomicrobiae bacterium]|nr:Mov34/MPN/PAD-1 family protein [Verrucomicrobiae bacterium]